MHRVPGGPQGFISGGDPSLRASDYRCYQAVTEPRQGLYVARLSRIVPEQAPEGGHCLVDRVGRNDDSRPDFIEELVDADHLARACGQAEKQPHHSAFEPDRFAFPRDLCGGGTDVPVSDLQLRRSGAVHRMDSQSAGLSGELFADRFAL